MTSTVNTTPNLTTNLASGLINGILGITPLARWAKSQARQLIINRAEKMGVAWRQEAQTLMARNWDQEWAKVYNPNLVYPSYYVCSFHAYDEGNLSWEAATEVEVAARSVHATIWPEVGININGDAKLRQTYHDILKQELKIIPNDIVDLGCSVGMSTFAIQEIYPQAQVTGVDLSPYFLSIAQYRSDQQKRSIKWLNAASEQTGLPSASFDLVSIFLVCHELPQTASKETFQEAKRLLRPGGYLTIMDMNPRSSVYQKMPPYVFTLLKSTEPYLDEYFTLDIEQALVDAGFSNVRIIPNTPRHRTVIAEAE